jgi:hypothetical protein
MKILFLSDINSEQHLTHDFEIENTTVYFSDLKVMKMLEGSGYNIQNYEFIEDKETGDDIYSNSKSIISEWYKHTGVDTSYHNGLSYGFIMEYELINPILNILKLTYIFKTILENNPQADVFSDFKIDSREFRILKICCISLGNGLYPINKRSITREENIEKNSHNYDAIFVDSKSPKGWMKHFLLYALLKVSMVVAVFRKTKSSVFVNYSKQIIKFLNQYRNEFSNTNILMNEVPLSWLVSHPNYISYIHKSILCTKAETIKRGSKNSLYFPDSNYYKEAGFKELANCWGIDQSELIAKYIDDLVKEVYPIISFYHEYYKTVFINENVKTIVLQNDCTVMNRLAVLLGKSMKINSIVVQHGILGWRFDENHMLGDYSAVWGELTKTDLIDEGLQKSRIFITGYLNGMPSINIKAKTSQGNVLRKILILTTNIVSYTPQSKKTSNHIFLSAVLKSVEHYNNICIDIKIHPAENIKDYEMYRTTAVKIYKNKNIFALLSESDIVIGTTSTVLFDALLYGKKVISYYPHIKGPPSPWRRFKEIAVVHNTKELAKEISRYYNGSPTSMISDESKYSFRDYLGLKIPHAPLPKDILQSIGART